MTTNVIALTGPPCSGKSTVCDLLDDCGVPTISTGEAIRSDAQDRYDDPDEDDVWDVAQSLRDEHGPAGPTIACQDWIEAKSLVHDVICVSGCRDEAEIEWLHEQVGPTLTVRVDADEHERIERYVHREIDQDRDVIPTERIKSLEHECYKREQREMPYPDHDVRIQNDDDVSINRIHQRLQNLVEVIRV